MVGRDLAWLERYQQALLSLMGVSLTGQHARGDLHVLLFEPAFAADGVIFFEEDTDSVLIGVSILVGSRWPVFSAFFGSATKDAPTLYDIEALAAGQRRIQGIDLLTESQQTSFRAKFEPTLCERLADLLPDGSEEPIRDGTSVRYWYVPAAGRGRSMEWVAGSSDPTDVVRLALEFASERFQGREEIRNWLHTVSRR